MPCEAAMPGTVISFFAPESIRRLQSRGEGHASSAGNNGLPAKRVNADLRQPRCPDESRRSPASLDVRGDGFERSFVVHERETRAPAATEPAFKTEAVAEFREHRRQ